jgi:hypothetical protein
VKALLATLATLTLSIGPGLALAQSAPAKKAPAPGVNKKLAPSAQKAVEENTPIDADPDIKLTEADLDIAKKVFVGEIPCELGAKVTIRPLRREGFFLISTKGHRFAMHPVESRTGAIRLEDPKRGAMWLQLGNKSMLMSQKLGQRLADECQSPEQITFAEKLKANPQPSILDAAPRQPATPDTTTTVPTAAPAAPAIPAATPASKPPGT